MPKTICLIHGVGFPGSHPSIHVFGDKLGKRTGANCIVSMWEHPGKFPVDPRSTAAFFGSERDFTWEVIMDFAYVVRNFENRVHVLPEADMYVGHSAGGVLALAKADQPCVIMGCPVQLIKEISQVFSARAYSQPILNLLHDRDPIAAPMASVTNKYLTPATMNEYFNPVAAHTSYWTHPGALNEVAAWYNEHIK